MSGSAVAGRRARLSAALWGATLVTLPWVGADVIVLLSGRDALENFLSDALGLDTFHEFARDLKMHVGGQEGGAHFLQCFRHVFFREFADPAKIAESGAEFFRE